LDNPELGRDSVLGEKLHTTHSLRPRIEHNATIVTIL
jgi:hypothetical protein